MKIEFDSPEEYEALFYMIRESKILWQKRRQHAQGKICLNVNGDKSSPYSEDDCRQGMEAAKKMEGVLSEFPHEESDGWNEETGKTIYKTVGSVERQEYFPPTMDEEAQVECLFGSAYEAEIDTLPQYGPRPDCQGNFIDFINTPAYADGRWNLGYKEES